MEPGQPEIDLLQGVLRVQNWVDNQLGTVGLDDLPGLLLAHHVDQVGTGLEGGDGREVGRARVHDAAAEHADSAALALVQVVVQLGHDGLHLLLYALGLGSRGEVLLPGLGPWAGPG